MGVNNRISCNFFLFHYVNFLTVDEDTEITVTVTYTHGSSNTVATTVTETITLTTIASPLVAHINGASKLTLGPQDSVLLDGSRSHDPDEMSSQGLTFQWTCLPVSFFKHLPIINLFQYLKRQSYQEVFTKYKNRSPFGKETSKRRNNSPKVRFRSICLLSFVGEVYFDLVIPLGHGSYGEQIS